MSRGQGIVLFVAAVAAVAIGSPASADDAIGWAELGPATDFAPAGMPDFDQRQRGWTSPIADESRPTTWTHDGPVAAAEALWWLDSRAEPRSFEPPAESDGFGLVTPFGFWDDHATSNVRPLVGAIAGESDTNGAAGLNPPYYGTCAELLEQALDRRLAAADTPGRFTIHHLAHPTTDELATAIRQERAVFLLVGFWQPYASGEWGRLGGHYVALQAADDHVDRVRLSDPFFDRHAPSFAPTLHNNAGRVSHDDYLVAPSLRPGPVLRLVDYFEGVDEVEALVANFQNHNRGDCSASDRPWVPAAPMEAHLDLAFVISPPEAAATATPTASPRLPTAAQPSPSPSPTLTPIPSRRPDRQTPPPPLPTRTSSPTVASTATAGGGTQPAATAGATTMATPAEPGAPTTPGASPDPGASPSPGMPLATPSATPADASGTATPTATTTPGVAPSPGATASGAPPEPATAVAGASATAPAGGATAATPAGEPSTATPDATPDERATSPATPSPAEGTGTPPASPSPGGGTGLPPATPEPSAGTGTAAAPLPTPGAGTPAATEPSATASAAGTPESATATPVGASTAAPSPTETVHPSPTRAPDRGDARPVRGGRLWLPMLLRARNPLP